MNQPDWHELKHRIIAQARQPQGSALFALDEGLTMQVFRLQAQHCAIYAEYLQALGRNPEGIKEVSQIPFLPISAFKHRQVLCLPPGEHAIQAIFGSSGTTGSQRSLHHVHDLDFYRQISQSIFESQFGPCSDWIFLALLPGYLERNDSSLVAMVSHFVEQSGHPLSGFYLDDFPGLIKAVEQAMASGRKVMLWGVTFALLQLAGMGPFDWAGMHIMETGGMKGRGRELVRQELHQHLGQAFGVDHICSEYGMTELLGQAYSKGQGIFNQSRTFTVRCFDLYDPLSPVTQGQRGAINIIDLANLYSCSFIQTHDLGRVLGPQQFEVLGRIDNSDLRGCNLLLSL